MGKKSNQIIGQIIPKENLEEYIQTTYSEETLDNIVDSQLQKNNEIKISKDLYLKFIDMLEDSKQYEEAAILAKKINQDERYKDLYKNAISRALINDQFGNALGIAEKSGIPELIEYSEMAFVKRQFQYRGLDYTRNNIKDILSDYPESENKTKKEERLYNILKIISYDVY